MAVWLSAELVAADGIGWILREEYRVGRITGKAGRR